MDILSLNPKTEAENITNFIKKTVHSRGFKQVIIACSGGIDSTTSLYLSVKALGKEHVYVLLLPYGTLSRWARADAELALKSLKMPKSLIQTIDIQPMVDAFAQKLSLKATLSQAEQIRLGNIMARSRMIILYDQAKKHTALVVGTENKSEHYLAYFTRFGDEASDIEPIRHLYKTQVYQLAAYLGVPAAIVKKVPTAGLWPGQTDEGQFGFTYKEADQILYGLYDQKKSVTRLVKEGFDKALIEKVKQWVEDNHFKHELPIVYTPNP